MKYILLLSLIATLSITCFSQNIKTIKLKQKAITEYTPKYFHITGVIDERSDTTTIGTMRAGMMNRVTPINLEGGAATALYTFIQNTAKQNTSTSAITLVISQLKISEKAVGMVEQADLTMTIGFSENGNKLIELTETAYVKTGIDASAYIGIMIRQSIEKAIADFDNWKADNNTNNVESTDLQQKTNIQVIMLTASEDADLIYFDKNVPLKISDFAGTPDDLSLAAALTFSGINMKYERSTNGHSTSYKITIAPYFDKTRSWCKKKIPGVLNHEQMHFNITAIKAYELSKAIQSYTFTNENFEKEINALFKKYDSENGKMQQQYDKETSHGQKADKQKEWNEKIIRLLSEYDSN
ncbi:MAG: DUF922 domain-containing protein [Bacteroidetes bacterium]|nr:DUF922 domain-containing protein [Bacteroidota bacterium]